MAVTTSSRRRRTTRHGARRLRPNVTVDAEKFLGFCRLATDPAADHELAAAPALELYRGEAVPSLGYREWAEAARRHLRQQALAMHDTVADETSGDGRLDEAIRSLLAALELEPIAEDRYLAAARLLAEQGRRFPGAPTARAGRHRAAGREHRTQRGARPTRGLPRAEPGHGRGEDLLTSLGL